MKWIGGILLTPILLFILLTILIYLPPVQNWLVRQVTAYASEKTGMSITVERVNLVFPLDLGVKGFRMIQPNDSLPQVKDTVADVRRLVVDVQLLPLFNKNVEIDALEFNDMKLNTADFVHEARVKGNVGRLYLKSHGIDWGRETINVDEALLSDAKVNVELSDTVPPDTTESQIRWKITVEKLSVAKTGVTVHLPGDTLQVGAWLGKADVADGFFDLEKSVYKVKRLDWTDGTLSYDNNFETRTKGLDYNHISLTDITLGVDTLTYSSPHLSLGLSACSFKEKSGIVIDKMNGSVLLDSTKVWLPAFFVSTPNSYLRANVAMDFDAFSDQNPGKLNLIADAFVGKQDIMRFMGDMPTAFIRRWPNYPLTVKTVLTGNLKYLKFAGLNVKLPTAFNINANGYAANVTDMKRLKAAVNLDARSYNLGFVETLLNDGGKSSGVRIPNGITAKGKLTADGQTYTADIVASEGGGHVKAKGKLNAAAMSYDASLLASNLHLNHFMPKSGMGTFSGKADVTGKGTDPMAASTRLEAAATVNKFSYDKYNLDGISFTADVSGSKAHATVSSENSLINGTLTLDALLSHSRIQSTFVTDLRHADWYGLRLTQAPLTTSFCCHVDVDTDMKNQLYLNGSVGSISIADSGKVYHPDDLFVDVLTNKDTTHVVAECGDFNLRLNGRYGYKRIMEQGEHFQKALFAGLKDKRLEVNELRKRLPLAELYLTTGSENPFGRFMKRMGFQFDDARIDMKSSPYNGLNGDMELFGLQNSSVKLDTIRFNIVSDTASCKYYGQVRNNKENPQYVFNALLDGYIYEKGSGANIKVYDAQDSLGLKLGAQASMEETGIKLHLLVDDPILGYKKFSVNEDNYIFMGRDRRISAELRLIADDGMGVHVYTNDENTEALQDLTVGLNKFDLEKVLTVIPYMPNITGTLNGDFHIIQTPEELSVSSALSVDSMTYERSRMGDISTEFVYMPKSDGTHTVDGILMCNDVQVADVQGSYKSEGEGELDVNLALKKLPMRLINGFMPDRIVRFSGYADGSLAVKGSLSHPQANGELTLDSCRMRSGQYGVRMRMSEGPLRIVGSNLLFEDYKMYADNDSPLTIDGNIDFSDVANMNMDLRMMAKNCQVIDSKERRRSVAFGKAFVDFFARMSGPIDNLKMQGALNVLGSTDMSYILRDSPLTTDNQMDELVRFTSFTDTTTTVVKHEPLTGFSMDLMMNIAEGAHVMCYLNTDHSNYIDLVGGGDLRLKYNAIDDLMITGKYTLANGEMKYSLPVIPLKTFTIQDGSYIEFTGDPMNPRLNITATERTRANVSSSDGQSRSVEFDCGVVITKTLADMGLEFTLDAPEDMTMSNELKAMSVEQRGKLAVTMLTTGMYLADGNTSGFSMNSALSSFLQSEINNITGNALRTLDLSFGMDNSTDGSGNTHTDYSFKFAKRFWNNRLRIVVGGKVSTGAEVANQNESFFDNVTFEYRLSNTGNKYVTLFYDNNAYDWLEGNTQEYGVGFIWRRSLQHFKDIFRFKNTNATPAPPDSTKTKANETNKE